MKKNIQQIWCTSYGGATNLQEESHDPEVLRLHLSINMFDRRCLRPGMRILQGRSRLHLLCLLEEMPQQGGVIAKYSISDGAVEPI